MYHFFTLVICLLVQKSFSLSPPPDVSFSAILRHEWPQIVSSGRPGLGYLWWLIFTEAAADAWVAGANEELRRTLGIFISGVTAEPLPQDSSGSSPLKPGQDVLNQNLVSGQAAADSGKAGGQRLLPPPLSAAAIWRPLWFPWARRYGHTQPLERETIWSLVLSWLDVHKNTKGLPI